MQTDNNKIERGFKVKKLKAFSGLLVLGIICIVVGFGMLPESEPIDPDYDYVADIKQLIKDKKYTEAKTIAEDVIALDLPSAKEAESLKTEAERESKKIWNRIAKAVRAFLDGNTDGTLEETGAAIASDMLVYGDIRDLCKQGWYKITGKETDMLIITLSTTGLVTELVDIADWLPAAFKALKKSGAMSKPIAEFTLNSAKNFKTAGKLDNTSKAFFKNTKNLIDKAGWTRSKNIFKQAKSADDLAVLSKSASQNPHLIHLVSKHAGSETVNVIKKHSNLKKIARIGKISSRVGKSIYKHGHLLDNFLFSDNFLFWSGMSLMILGVGFSVGGVWGLWPKNGISKK